MRVHQSSAKDQECLRLGQWLYRNKATEQGGHGRLLPDSANIVFKEDVPKFLRNPLQKDKKYSNQLGFITGIKHILRTTVSRLEWFSAKLLYWNT